MNKILSITRNIVPYVKELRPLAGSVTACILMQQLDYWFSIKPGGFYKFINVCDHPKYKQGDSWCEELSFSVEEYRSAFEKIGVRYKSKNLFMQANDKFNGKFYACFHDRQSNQTFYVRNHELLDKVLDELISVKASDKNLTSSRRNSYSKLKKDPNTVTRECLITGNKSSSFTVTGESLVTGTRLSQNTERDISCFENKNIPHSLYKDTNTTTENITDSSLLSLNKTCADINVEKEMINIWNKIVEEGANPINLTPARKRQLDKALLEHFNSNVSEWEAFCHLISASKWLMGESGKSTWKASIDWALLPENIVKIKEKSYGIGDRKKLEKEHVTRAAEEEKLKSQILNRRFDEIIQKARGLRKEELLNIENSLDQQALEALKEEFQESIRNGVKGQGAKDSFNELGWNMPFIDTIYQGFKEERLLASHEAYLQNAAEELGYDLNQMQHLIERHFSNITDNA